MEAQMTMMKSRAVVMMMRIIMARREGQIKEDSQGSQNNMLRAKLHLKIKGSRLLWFSKIKRWR
jgi:hypothetical protein